MSTKKNIYCLVFWKEEKSFSVIEEQKELVNIGEGKETDLVVKGTSYKIILLARSENKNQLKKMEVSREGKILNKESLSRNVSKRNVNSDETNKKKRRNAVENEMNNKIFQLGSFADVVDATKSSKEKNDMSKKTGIGQLDNKKEYIIPQNFGSENSEDQQITSILDKRVSKVSQPKIPKNNKSKREDKKLLNTIPHDSYMEDSHAKTVLAKERRLPEQSKPKFLNDDKSKKTEKGVLSSKKNYDCAKKEQRTDLTLDKRVTKVSHPKILKEGKPKITEMITLAPDKRVHKNFQHQIAKGIKSMGDENATSNNDLDPHDSDKEVSGDETILAKEKRLPERSKPEILNNNGFNN
ncbi:uncharacterized protein LOC127286036 [Leptopilina boulardi]|uniref:uncharacterized protein LOC127286036 n=1 Tax=Leptopilina boulardi TaxID=63433 RepID=UPI0021F5DC81|nr:uncharacterized protein LOC127286036 [Leptopilina boulardi]